MAPSEPPSALLLFRVVDAFAIKQRDMLVVVPDSGVPDGLSVRAGDPVLIRTPDNPEIKTSIAGLGFVDPNPRGLVSPSFFGLSTGDVPPGSWKLVPPV
jgi:hypothetical protein